MSENVEITGGASPEISAAIAAVVAGIETEEETAMATGRRRTHRSRWIEAVRPLDRASPVTTADQSQPPESTLAP